MLADCCPVSFKILDSFQVFCTMQPLMVLRLSRRVSNFNQSWTRCLHFTYSSRNSRGVVPPTNSPEDLKQHLKDSASYDEAINDEQKSWPTSSYHDDAETVKRRKRDVDVEQNAIPSHELPPDAVDDRDNTVILFPGQGSQYVGMSKAVSHLPSVKDLYENASQILGYDLLKMSIEGPQTTLDLTRYCQPAVVVSSLAAIEACYEKSPQLVRNCVRTAGFSVGEITALIFSGALSLEDGKQAF